MFGSMFGSELYLIAAIAAGFAFLFGRERVRRHHHLESAKRRGLLLGDGGLRHLPGSFQKTVLFAIADGGHERDVLQGELSLPPVSRDSASQKSSANDLSAAITVFQFAFQRDVRGEWGYLDTRPRFRVFSPITVVAFALPMALPRVLIKRRGRAEVIAEEGYDRYKSVVAVVRDVSTIERATAVEPPAGLPREPENLGKPWADYLVWTNDPVRVKTWLDDSFSAFLRSPSVAGRELVVEVIDALLVVYCAKDGDLEDRDADVFVEMAKQLCRHLYRAWQATHDTDADTKGRKA